jgi:glycyl-tRNA synthetase beta chain
VEPALLRDAAEKALFGEIVRVETEVSALRAARDWPAVLRSVASLKPAVDAFFDGVLVMADDAQLRQNRLGLMRRVGALFGDVADFRRIQAEGPHA